MKRTNTRTTRKNNPIIDKIIQNEPLTADEANRLSTLTEVGLYNIHTDFASMHQLPLLRHVTFLLLFNVSVSMSDIPRLFPLVQVLYISYTDEQLLPSFTEMVGVEYLQLKAIRNFKFVYEGVAKMPKLRNLTLKHMPDLMAIPIAEMGWYPQLVRLKVSACPNMIEYCEHTYLIKSLRTLIIYGKKGEHQGLSAFNTCVFPPNLTTIKMRSLNIPYPNKCFPMGIYDLQSLTTLSIRYCMVIEMPIKLLALGRTLVNLSLRYCGLVKVPTYFKDMVKLRVVILSNNLLQEVPFFVNCPHLSIVNLSHNQISSLDAVQFANIAKAKAVSISYNNLHGLPFPLSEYPSRLSPFMIFNVRGNMLTPEVEDFIEKINRYRTRPAELQAIPIPKMIVPRPITYETRVHQEDIDSHMVALTPALQEMYQTIYPEKKIETHCIYCLDEFSHSNQPYVCCVYHNEIVRYFASIRNIDESEVRRILPSTEIDRQKIEHYGHVLHRECFVDALGKIFACPGNHLFRFDLSVEEDELVRSLKMARLE